MAKKVLMILLSVMLIASLTLISCSQEGKKPGPAPQPLEPVENEDGDHSENLAEGCDFESGEDYIIKEDGAEIQVVPNVGIENSSALYVFQNSGGGWGETIIDATKFYGRGKSYYVEAWFKNIGGEGAPDDKMAHIDFTVVSGAGYDKYGRVYDVDGQYDYSWLSDDQASAIFEMPTSGSAGVDIKDGSWHKLSAILDAETIDTMINTQTEAMGSADTEPSLYYMAFVFFMGEYPNQDGHKYYLDNIVIIDPNSEIETTGRTWVDPASGGDDPDED